MTILQILQRLPRNGQEHHDLIQGGKSSCEKDQETNEKSVGSPPKRALKIVPVSPRHPMGPDHLRCRKLSLVDNCQATSSHCPAYAREHVAYSVELSNIEIGIFNNLQEAFYRGSFGEEVLAIGVQHSLAGRSRMVVIPSLVPPFTEHSNW